MAAYVDGFVIPVPKKRLADYRRLAQKLGKIWIEYGALAVNECVADDVTYGKLTSFPRAVKVKRSETVVFSWIAFKSRRQRDDINAKVMRDPRVVAMEVQNMPLDGKRMIFGGFKTLVSLDAED